MIQAIKNIFKKKELPIKEGVFLDVRTKSEYQSGHIKNAVNIPVDQIQSNIKKIEKYNKPVIAYCKSGARSGLAVRVLKTYNIEAFNGGSKSKLEKRIEDSNA